MPLTRYVTAIHEHHNHWHMRKCKWIFKTKWLWIQIWSYRLILSFNMNLLSHDSTLRNVTVISVAGKYLGQMGITPADTTDNSGCKRFQRYNVNYVMGTHTHSLPSSTRSLSNKMVSPPYCILCSDCRSEWMY